MLPITKLPRIVLAIGFGCLLCADLQAHPDKVEDRLVLHFAAGSRAPENGKWPDLTGHFIADLQGGPIVTNIGPAVALKLDGDDDCLLVPMQSRDLPSQAFSVATWLMVNDTASSGGIAGCYRTRPAPPTGFALGFERGAITFWLATEGSTKPNATRIRSHTQAQPGRWHFVVATYDGSEMRLFVDGQPEASSNAQTGGVAYPDQATFTVGAVRSGAALNRMDGALYEFKLYSRALPRDEILATMEKQSALVSYRSPINTALRFVVVPYLQFATKQSIIVMCETSEPSRMTVEYGEQQPLRQRVSSSATNSINTVLLEGLRPATPYFYRVTCADGQGNLARSEIATFQTAPEENAAWAFGILGDTQRNPEVTRKCADGIFALRPNFMLHCGDVVDDGFAKHQWVGDLFAPCSNLFAHVPTFPVIGNHEKNAHWYYDYFSLPEPEYFYTFHYGNAQFFMIDSNKDLAPGSEQYQCLERELAASKATWKFTCHHHPCFSSDEDDYGDRWKGKAPQGYVWGDKSAKHLIPLYEKYGVDIAFAGHIHSYERTWPILQMSINQKNGVRYIVSGGGGGGLEQAGPQRAWFTLHVHRGHHYCFAAVQDKTIDFKAYDLDGRLFDSFALSKEGAGGK